jgi:hypothetical protein
MKKLILSIVAIATISLSSFGQAPEGFKYQAVVRDAGNVILNNQTVGIRLTIQQDFIGGTTVYQETFAPTTNAYGLVNLEIGSGTVVSGDFTTIDWSLGTYYMQTAVDIFGGANYTVMGTNQLMSVPYALHANTAENVTNDQVNDADADPANELNIGVVLNGTDLETTDASGTIITDLSSLQDGVTDADADPANEIQVIVSTDTQNNITAGTDGGAYYMAGGNVSGDVKQGFQVADHNGWILMDGRAITTLTITQQTAANAVGFITNLPDATNRVLKQTAVVNTVGGSDNITIAQSNLPSYNVTGTTSLDGTHSHTATTDTVTHDHVFSGSVVGPQNTHIHGFGGNTNPTNAPDAGGGVGQRLVIWTNSGQGDPSTTVRDSYGTVSHGHGYSGTTSSSGHPTTGFVSGNTSTDNHSHAVTVSTSGDHTHNINLPAGGSGASLNVENAFLSVNMFVYLGM